MYILISKDGTIHTATSLSDGAYQLHDLGGLSKILRTSIKDGIEVCEEYNNDKWSECLSYIKGTSRWDLTDIESKGIKLTANTILGICEVEDFEGRVEIMSQEDFYSSLDRNEGGFIGCEVDPNMFAKIEKEYGVGLLK